MNQNSATVTLRKNRPITNNASSGVNTISAGVELRGGSDAISVATGGTLVFSGGIDINDLQTKSGGGTLVLSGTQAGTATSRKPFAVSDGTLLVNMAGGTGRDRTSSDNWSVASGGILGGTGQISLGANTTTIQNVTVSGAFAPGGNGTQGAQIATFNINAPDPGALNANGTGSSVIMASGSSLNIDLSSTSGVSDLLSITGDSSRVNMLDLTAGGVKLSLSGSFTPSSMVGSIYTIATFDDSSTPLPGGYGTFSSVEFNGVATSDFTVNYNPSSITLEVTAVPEPSTALLLIGALLPIIYLRRRRSFQNV